MHMTNAMTAWATFETINATTAIVEVSYPNGGFGIERVTAPRKGSLYEAAYRAASIKAAHQGYRLDRFARA